MSEKLMARLLELALIAAVFTVELLPDTASMGFQWLVLAFLLRYVQVIFIYAIGFFFFEQLNLTEFISRKKSPFIKVLVFITFLIIILIFAYLYATRGDSIA